MSVFDRITPVLRKVTALFRRPEDDGTARLCESGLQKKWERNAKLIAFIACSLMLADAVFSYGGSSVRIFQENGQIYLLRPSASEGAGRISLRASAGKGETLCEKPLDLTILPMEPDRSGDPNDPAGSGEDPEASSESGEKEDPSAVRERLSAELSGSLDGFNDDLTRRKLPLPRRLPGGEAIRWSIRRSSHLLPILMIGAALIILTYFQRFAPLKKEQERMKESILLDLPEFVNQLVLLLGAGMVLTAAFEQTVREHRASGKESFFYRNLESIRSSLQTTNASFDIEFRRFAKTTGVNELIRVSSIISDNISKGAALTEKLESEADLLWNRRKLLCEERGRLSETKMTFPLSVFLCVLIVITVAPALIEL